MALEVVTEEVAANLEEVAVATRRLTGPVVGAFGGGSLLGTALGLYLGLRLATKKAEEKAFKQSEEDVAAIRKFYLEGAAGEKDKLEDIVEEKGYLFTQKATGAQAIITTDEIENIRPLRAPAPVKEPEPLTQVQTEVGGSWNYALEQQNRSAEFPYIIHEDEYDASETGYVKVEYTFYEGDTVLSDDENNTPIENANIVVGLGNLRFGHGSFDEDVVHIRNDTLRLDIEITRVPGTFAEDVLGLDTNDAS